MKRHLFVKQFNASTRSSLRHKNVFVEIKFLFTPSPNNSFLLDLLIIVSIKKKIWHGQSFLKNLCPLWQSAWHLGCRFKSFKLHKKCDFVMFNKALSLLNMKTVCTSYNNTHLWIFTKVILRKLENRLVTWYFKHKNMS